MASEHVVVANDFFHDALDLLYRFRLTKNHFSNTKSRRMKLFLDLRMAVECILKSYASYFLLVNARPEEVIPRVEGYKHNILKMANDVKSEVPADEWTKFEPFVKQLSTLPMGLRYRLDEADFRKVNQDFYYATVGSDLWLEALHNATLALTAALNTHLVSHSRILSGAEIWEELQKPQHNKYAKK